MDITAEKPEVGPNAPHPNADALEDSPILDEAPALEDEAPVKAPVKAKKSSNSSQREYVVLEQREFTDDDGSLILAYIEREEMVKARTAEQALRAAYEPIGGPPAGVKAAVAVSAGRFRVARITATEVKSTRLSFE